MDIVGYSDRLSIVPGDTMRFMVSSKRPSYTASLVRPTHRSHRPPDRPEPAFSGSYPGREQPLRRGSYVSVPDDVPLSEIDSFTLQAWIFATTPTRGAQGLLTKWTPSTCNGYGLFLDGCGALCLRVGERGGSAEWSTGVSLRESTWYSVAASFDGATGTAALYQQPVRRWPGDSSARIVHEAEGRDLTIGRTSAPFIVAGYWDDTGPSGGAVAGHFNGKLDRPCLFDAALEARDVEQLLQGVSPAELASSLVACWDFASDIASTRITDTGPHGLHGETVNAPMRAATGHNWTGREVDFKQAPAEYGAVHFHEDDLDDARWDVDFEVVVPADMKSAIYAVRLVADNGRSDHVPFFVQPGRDSPRSQIAFLVPVFSYLAYANEHNSWKNVDLGDFSVADVTDHVQIEDHYAADNSLLSLYESHADGSGTCYSSRLRPIANMRPYYDFPLVRGPHQLSADLHVTDWLEAKGHEFDVITDEALHLRGSETLGPYRVLVTGTHPEYWTEPMLAALEAYLEGGGRLLYLGGNGFYWVTSVDAERPHLIEVRRGRTGSRSWESAPGENYHSTTGELGGLWRDRGRSPQSLVGVGFTSQGFDTASPYRRQEGSFDQRASFIFEGIERDEIIGDFGLVLNGAAGFELDRADHALGTPPHALLLASSYGHSDAYQAVVEEVMWSDSQQGGTVNPRVRADMLYFEYPNGGAVFATGSIAWGTSLPENGYDNNVSRITDNVLRKFASDWSPGAVGP